MTAEQREYGPGWLTCPRCGLTAKDVAPICPTEARCARVRRGESLGGKPLEFGPLVRFELTDGELDATAIAVARWKGRSELALQRSEDEFLATCAAECRCCSRCAVVPCPGVTAGGLCDEMCHCAEDDFALEAP